MFSCLTASPKSKKKQKQPGGSKIATRKLLARLLPAPTPPTTTPPLASSVDNGGGGGGSSGDLQGGQLHSLMKHLHGDRLARLALAVEIGTAGVTDCVRLEPGGPDSTELQLGRHRVNARALCLRAWRFADLADGEAVAPLTEACCSRLAGQCVNPFHFYRAVAAAPDLQCLLDRLSQLELKLPLVALSDTEVSSSGCSSDSLLSGRKSWLTSATATAASSSSAGTDEQRRQPLASSCGSCCSCSCSCSWRSGEPQPPPPPPLPSQHRRFDPYVDGDGDGDGDLAEPPSEAAWCTLAYWEGRSRVGQPVPVRDPVFHVFHRRPLSDGLSLEALASGPLHQPAAQPPPPPPHHVIGVDPDGELARQAARTRAKIGPGVTLVRRRRRRHRDVYDGDGEGDGHHTELVIYNQSEHAVFVHSPTLQPPPPLAEPGAPYQAVKLPPHCCLKAFDSAAAGLLCRARRLGLSTSATSAASPFLPAATADPYTVRLSFVKGFGAAYQRQDIIYCPCWLEVMLSFAS